MVLSSSHSHLSWILLTSSRPQPLHRPQTPGGAQHLWLLPSLRLLLPQTLGGDLLSLQLLILGVVQPPRQPLGIPGGLQPLQGPLLTLGVGLQLLQLERGPHLTHGEALMVSTIFCFATPWASYLFRKGCPGHSAGQEVARAERADLGIWLYEAE